MSDTQPSPDAALPPDDWFQQLMGQIAQVRQPPVVMAPRISIWRQSERPWWAPDLANMVAISIVVITGVALFYRMTHPTEVNDKLLDMMLTILFGTAFVALVNFVYGSSRSSQTKDDRANAVVDKLLPQTPVNGNGASHV